MNTSTEEVRKRTKYMKEKQKEGPELKAHCMNQKTRLKKMNKHKKE